MYFFLLHINNMYKYLITDTYKLEFNLQLKKKKSLKLFFRTRYPYINVHICATLCNDIVC